MSAFNGEDNEGAVFVYMGSAAGLVKTQPWQVESNQAKVELLGIEEELPPDRNNSSLLGKHLEISEGREGRHGFGPG